MWWDIIWALACLGLMGDILYHVLRTQQYNRETERNLREIQRIRRGEE